MKNLLLSAFLFCVVASCAPKETLDSAEQWVTYEITLISETQFINGYTDAEVWAEFTNEQGEKLTRPAFWDGGQTWKVRFASPDAPTAWTWTTFSTPEDKGLSGKTGRLRTVEYTGKNELVRHGLLRMSPGRRNVVHADGTPFLVVGDTPWAIPFRATTDQVLTYARDRQKKGFNTALLMSVQPDRYAEGPDQRNISEGFARAFDDLPEGHLNKLKPEYFAYLDSLTAILVDHGIVPVYQPVFHGFGWKGKTVLGTTADPEEYARYCRYLVARYGSQPAFWLVSGDGTGRDPGVKPGGEAIEKWDAYHQPAGIHYNPADNHLPEWAQGDSTKGFHFNRTYQEEAWLDFQWAQSGHDGKHLTYKVEQMYDYEPVKAVLNGEPTYEGMGGGRNGLGWWQGEEAWTQLMHGETMGVVYGAAGLWQWKVSADEPGWDEWTNPPFDWKHALGQEGSQYVGFVSRAFKGYDFADMERRWDLAKNNKPLLAKERIFYISYLRDGGELAIPSLPAGLPFAWFDPKTGEWSAQGTTQSGMTLRAPDNNPWVVVIGNRRP
jgi:hypothetical protein